MAITDSLSATFYAKIDADLTRAQSYGGFAGKDSIDVNKTQSFTDGSDSQQATGWFSSQFTATTDGITISLADSADPLGTAGDDVPTSDPEGKKLRALFIINEDTTNYIELENGTNALADMLTGTSAKIRIGPRGFLAISIPDGYSAMNDGSDDELKITANTSSCSVKITYMFG